MDPTETPTPTPRWDWATPTPMTLEAPDPDTQIIIDSPNEFFVDVAEYGVQTYTLANQTGEIDNIMWIVIVAIILLGIRNILKKVKNL